MAKKFNLPVAELDFDKLKNNLIDFLKNQDQFKDYNFEGSNLNVLLDLLAYTGHYTGIYSNLNNAEAFIESARLLNSMHSKAKFLNYTPKSYKASRAIIKLSLAITAENEPADKKVLIKRGTTFKSENNIRDNRTFILVDDIYIYNQKTEIGQYDYTSDEFMIYEGKFETRRFIYDSLQVNQRFTIPEKNIDIETLLVEVLDNKDSTVSRIFKRPDDFMMVNGESPVYFLQKNEDDRYQIYFGNGIYGQGPSNGNMIRLSYVLTNGISGNNAQNFVHERTI